MAEQDQVDEVGCPAVDPVLQVVSISVTLEEGHLTCGSPSPLHRVCTVVGHEDVSTKLLFRQVRVGRSRETRSDPMTDLDDSLALRNLANIRRLAYSKPHELVHSPNSNYVSDRRIEVIPHKRRPRLR